MPQSQERAVQLFTLAMENGVSMSCHNLGLRYTWGKVKGGVTHSYTKAREYYRIAASHGNVMSMTNLAILLMNGHGGPQNVREALVLLRRASAAGHDRATENLSLYNNLPQDVSFSSLPQMQAVTGEGKEETRKRHLRERCCSSCFADLSQVMNAAERQTSMKKTKKKGFLSCSCKVAQYCNKNCQGRHWKAHREQHRKLCINSKSNKSSKKSEKSEKVECGELSAELIEIMRIESTHLRMFKKEGVRPSASMSWDFEDHVGHFPTQEQKDFFCSTLFPIINIAYFDFKFSSKAMENPDKQDKKEKEPWEIVGRNKEGTLTELFNAMVEHESLFMLSFENVKGYVLPERCTGMLGTLTTILRQRGDLIQAEVVMEMYTKTIDAYEAVLMRLVPEEGGGDLATFDHNNFTCMESLRYKWYLIRLNMMSDTQENIHDEKLGKMIRWVCSWEIRTGVYRRDDDIWTWCLLAFGAIRRTEEKSVVTLRKLKKVSNVNIAKCIRRYLRHPMYLKMQQDKSQFPLVVKQRCARCNKEEPFINVFQKCGRCVKRGGTTTATATYCGPECQKIHWSEHKKECKL